MLNFLVKIGVLKVAEKKKIIKKNKMMFLKKFHYIKK